MSILSVRALVIKTLAMLIVALSAGISVFLAAPSTPAMAQQACPTGVTYAGDEAPNSTLKLQMPFLSGEYWTVGGGGSFYGNNFHCNSYNDHYATDWNRPNDAGAAVLAVADGQVSASVGAPCPTGGYGCRVTIEHADGYKTTYAHLQDVKPGIVDGSKVKTGMQVGFVGSSGTTADHLHLAFRRNNSSTYNTSGYCAAGETLMPPQGHKPSPRMTALGPVNLEDGTNYQSINGRVYLPNLRTASGWQSVTVTVKNNSDQATTVNYYYRDSGGTNACNGSQAVQAYGSVSLNPSCAWFIPAAGYIEADRDVSVTVANRRTSPVVEGTHTGVSAAVVWGPFNLPLVAKRLTTASGLADSDIFVQNAADTATTVQVQLVAAPGSGYTNITRSFTLNAYGTLRYSLKVDGSVPTGWVGSAVVSAPASAVVSDFFAWDGQTDFAYNAYPSDNKASSWYIPLFMVRRTGATGDASTPISVQNLTGNNTTISTGQMVLSCKAAPGWTDFAVSNPSPVSDNASYSFNPATDLTLFPPSMTGWWGSCKLTVPNDKKVLVLAQIRYPANKNASAYEASRAANSDRQLFFPVIKQRLGDGSATAVTIQNLNSSAVVSATFYYKGEPALCAGSGDVTVSDSIPPDSNLVHNHRLPNWFLPDGWCGSLRVVSNQPIDGFGQITNINTYASGDTIQAYSALSRP